jgi:hypothetical protein
MSPDEDALNELSCYTLSLGDRTFIHQHVVDASAAQNADEHTKPIAVTFALLGLYLHLEKQFTGRQVQRVHMALAKKREQWPKFPLPADRGSITAADVMAVPPGTERDQAIDRWCQSVWAAFHDSRQQIIDLLRDRGFV